jgi:hypothetical protein
MAHISVSTTVAYCLQSELPTQQSANITVQCTKNVSVSESIINDWLVHNELERTWNEVITACLKHYCNLRSKWQGKADKIPSDWLVPWTRFKQGIAICTIPSVYLYSSIITITRKVPYSYITLPGYVHTLAATTIHCMPATAQSKVRW